MEMPRRAPSPRASYSDGSRSAPVSVLTASVGLFVWNRLPVGMRRRLLLSAFSAPNGATAALLTPIATPANMMVMGPAG